MTTEVGTARVVEEAPAGNVTDAGTVAAALLEESVTTTLLGAGPDSVIVQELESPPTTVPDAHVIDERRVGWRVIDVVAVPAKVALIVAATLVGTAEVDALNDPDVAPAAMLKLGGTDTEEELLDKEAGAPPAGAGPDRATVQVVTVPLLRVEGEQPIEDTVGGWIASGALAKAPLYRALSVVVTVLETPAVVTVNDPELAPAGIVKLAGTAAALMLLDKLTVAPPAGAA